MNVDKFLEKIKNRPAPYKGKLAVWHDDILKLRQAGCTYAQIVEYLKLQNVTVTIPAVQRFCSKHLASEKKVMVKERVVQTSSKELAKENNEIIKKAQQTDTQKELDDSNEIPVQKKLPEWFNADGFTSVEDLI